MITLFLLFIMFGYPSDAVVIPITIALVLMGIVNCAKGMREEYENYKQSKSS